MENSAEYNYDELNEYEYDDDFDLPKTQCTSFQKDTDNFTSELNTKPSPKKRSALLLFTDNLFSKDRLKASLLNVTNTQHAHFKSKSPGSNKYQHYGYKSTEKAPSFGTGSAEKDLTVSYDIDKCQVDSKATESVREGCQSSGSSLINVETNPLDRLDLVAESITQRTA